MTPFHRHGHMVRFEERGTIRKNSLFLHVVPREMAIAAQFPTGMPLGFSAVLNMLPYS